MTNQNNNNERQKMKQDQNLEIAHEGTARRVKVQHSSPTAILVSGMHRSGTSALSGLLSNLGCDAPATLMKSTPDNPKGYFESEKIYRFNDEILRNAGSSWDDFRQFPQTWLNSPKCMEYMDRGKELIKDEFGSSRLFVFKDPRICRLTPFWAEVLKSLNITPIVIHIHRNPLEVSQSLRGRDQIDPYYGMLLWLTHIIEAEHGSRTLKRAFTSYENILQNWTIEAERLSKELGISWPRFSQNNMQEIEKSIDSNLRHYSTKSISTTDNGLLPASIREAYAIMQKWLETGPQHSDMQRLDHIRKYLSDATDTFGPVVQSRSIAIQADRENLRKKEATINLDLRKLIEERDEEIRFLYARNAELEQLSKDTECALRERKEVTAALEKANVSLDELSCMLIEKENQIDKLKSQIKEQLEVNKKGSEKNIELKKRLSELDIREVRNRRGIDRRDKEILELTRTIIKCQQEVKEASVLRAKWQEDVTVCKARIEDLLNSTSWRITAPMRRLSQIIMRRP